jgi:hypothetical protein
VFGIRISDFHKSYRRIIISIRISRALLGKKWIYATVAIHGNTEFINATIKALEILKEQIPDAYNLVLKHVGDIVSGKPSGVFPDMLWLGPTFVIMGPAYSERTAIEYAGALAHEAYHCELYRRAEMNGHGSSVPVHAYAGEDAEKLCLDYQCDVLRRLGLDQSIIEEYENGLQTRWWEIPFEQRDW